MARDRTVFLAMYLVLAVMEANALQCYQKEESECSGSNEACETIASPRQEDSVPVVNCSRFVESCFSAIATGIVPNGTVITSFGSCTRRKEANLTINRCYNKLELQELSRSVLQEFVIYGRRAGIIYNTYTYCTCNKSLCNDFTDDPTTITPTATPSSIDPLHGFSNLLAMILTGLSMSFIKAI
ncbi:hypothetical protein HOLleu_01593 [Holothuria leucospilota]|uniref:Uncharacterized protein n=1 Tax=Holothuria leucospilota TaxID=206669 RepID=A0A9Q1CP84_HOLLE|nr:hypothetical protein HOLleu_01593 [Holothuria leucospilota]